VDSTSGQNNTPPLSRRDRLREFFKRPWIQRSAIAAVSLFVILVVVAIIWIIRLDRNISERFAEKRFAPPIEFYSSPEEIRPGSRYPSALLEEVFTRKAYIKRSFGQSMRGGDYAIWSGGECLQHLGDTVAPTATPEPSLDAAIAEATPIPGQAAPQTFTAQSIARCVVFVNRGKSKPGSNAEERAQIIALTTDGSVVGVYDKDSRQTLEHGLIEPELFAQYYGDKPVLRNVVTISSGDVPPLCLNALLAIEDDKFYEHPGISFTGLLRAVYTNLRSGRKAQGGSTITQQLVKNYFLTDERTFKRKFVEIAMAFLVERHATKDDILETYINLIYMGQNGPFEVRGFAAASQHYFGKPLRTLNLPECALLAGVLNGPGVYNPVRHPDRALKRRTLVLNRMRELKYIDEATEAQANATPLPAEPERSLTEPAPYYVQAVRRELESRGVETENGARIYTGLNLRAQEAAHLAVRQGLDRLETTNPFIKKIKATGKNLEAVLISANPVTGEIQALVGGRGFTATQYNRAIDAHRQVGSIMKPLVYLTAFENNDASGQPYSPLSLLPDKATTHRFEGQKWTPKNFDGKYNGDVPVYYALKESLNAATVNLGMEVTPDRIIETARALGVVSKLKPLPSITLGAFELTPLEVLQTYSSIANFGKRVPLSLVERIEDLNGNEIFTFTPAVDQAAPPDATAELIGSMKQAFVSGTARGARLSGFTHPAAGKTGTTNDQKDAWFAGFTPSHVAIAWVGYDDNTGHKLTGGSGAVPLWTSYMKAYASTFPNEDFPWPDGTEAVTFTPEQMVAFGTPEKDFAKEPTPVTLVFKAGLAPKVPESTDGAVAPAEEDAQ
jgi:penicillin-binding protein 1B